MAWEYLFGMAGWTVGVKTAEGEDWAVYRNQKRGNTEGGGSDTT